MSNFKLLCKILRLKGLKITDFSVDKVAKIAIIKPN